MSILSRIMRRTEPDAEPTIDELYARIDSMSGELAARDETVKRQHETIESQRGINGGLTQIIKALREEHVSEVAKLQQMNRSIESRLTADIMSLTAENKRLAGELDDTKAANRILTRQAEDHQNWLEQIARLSKPRTLWNYSVSDNGACKFSHSFGDICQHARQAIDLADEKNVPVSFDFNGIEIVACRGNSVSDICLQYSKARERHSSKGIPSPPFADVPVASEAIPAGVYWSDAHSSFYSSKNRIGMGEQFYRKWKDRSGEFPTSPDEIIVPGHTVHNGKVICDTTAQGGAGERLTGKGA